MSAEQTGWKQQPDEALVVGFLRSYLSNRQRATRAERTPVPLLSQLIDKPNIRREVGGVFVAALVELDERLKSSDPVTTREDAKAAEALTMGERIFELLRTQPIDQEGTLAPEAAVAIHQAAGETGAAVGLRQLSELLTSGLREDWRSAVGIASVAGLAIDLYAISQSAETAA